MTMSVNNYTNDDSITWSPSTNYSNCC